MGEFALGNINEARYIFENALKQFSPGSESKLRIWRSYELMEQKIDNNSRESQNVYQRYIRDTIAYRDDFKITNDGGKRSSTSTVSTKTTTPRSTTTTTTTEPKTTITTSVASSTTLKNDNRNATENKIRYNDKKNNKK